jgi:hypothetical protein
MSTPSEEAAQDDSVAMRDWINLLTWESFHRLPTISRETINY